MSEAMAVTLAVIDDDVTFLGLLYEVLSSQGYNVAVFSDPVEFCNHPADDRGRNFDLILTDINMPCKNGVDFCSTIKTIGYHCPIMGMSGNNLKVDMSNFQEQGFDAFLLKPFDLDYLIETIKKLLKVRV